MTLLYHLLTIKFFSVGEHQIAKNPDINRNLGDFNRAVSDADSYNWSMDAPKG